MPVTEKIGLDAFKPDQELWRFSPVWKAEDLFRTAELYLTQVSKLRLADPRESRLPDVLRETFSRSQFSPAVRDFMTHYIEICEDQATGVFASCWFLPGSQAQEHRMWSKYGGGSDGGLLLVSSLDRLISALPDDMMLFFGIGSVRYIVPDMDYTEAAFGLNGYQNVPFLLKLRGHEDDREVRLFQRYRGPLLESGCLRPRISVPRLVKAIRLSPLCSADKRKTIYAEFTTKGLPKHFFDYDGT
jgi:hypothetical protein